MNKEDVRHQLSQPRSEARGRTRWWWYGCAVERDEIIRELDFMKDAQIGGVELQILYPVEPDKKEKGIQNYEYLSPGYFEMIRFAAEETAKRGMQFDLTLGSSWPFGGPFLTEELSGPSVLPFCLDVEGPCRFSKDLTTVIYGKVAGAVLGKMEGAQMLPETMADISEHVVDKYLFNWPWGTEIEEIMIPEGVHKIVLFVSSDKRQRVLKPLRGGEGLIIDHNRKESLRAFLEYGGDPIVEAVGRGKITNFFCDSIEVFGHNWTDILYEEFLSRRGYELRPYIYALWGEVKGLTEQIRYDFQKTMGELTVENFFRELTDWCHEKGAVSRIQAHGTWGDILQAYGAADIPEGETFSDFDRYEVNTVHRRLAVSAGHIYHKPIISNESFTWLRFPRFVVSLENIKAAADSIFLDGVNQIVNHGYSYSKEDREGMTAFYASTNISHTNTWWKYYKEISVYINRVCDFLQRGKPAVSTAVYLPQHDIWAETPLADTHMCMKLDERLEVSCVDAIQKAGYWFDYVNDDVLENWEDYEYDTLLLIECDHIPLNTMKKIRQFAENGGKVIAAGRIPDRSCGRLRFEEETAEIHQIGSELQKQGNIVVTEDKFDSLIQELRRTKEPDVLICHHPETVGYVHRKTASEDIYFISNISQNNFKENIKFTTKKRGFCVFDPMTGKEKSVCQIKASDGEIQVNLDMQAYQSLLFVFSDEMDLPEADDTTEKEIISVDLSCGWRLTIPEREFGKEYDVLDSWEKEPQLKYYSGSGKYSRSVQITEEMWMKLQRSDKVLLNLEHLRETAEIYVNGTLACTVIKRPHQADITGLLCQGENRIELIVTNLLINRMIDPEYPELLEEKIIPEWPYATGGLNRCREERVFNWREREMIKAPFPSGIWGEIKIVGKKRGI